MTPTTRLTAIRALQQRASELRSRIDAHLKGDAQKAFEAWKEDQSREARRADKELEEVLTALEELERL